MNSRISGRLLTIVLLAAGLWLVVPGARAQEAKPQFTIYGFAMLDAIMDLKQGNPDWWDVMRPTKLPAYKDEYGKDGRFYAGVRQSRLGVKASFPTGLGDLKTIFEFEMFGVGVDAGQTTIRLRHAFGEIGQFGAGQTWSVFMDADIFPNSFEYWGPSGMVFFRNVQVRWMPYKDGDTRFAIALERPGASADGGVYADRIELRDITPRFPVPDLTAEYHLAQPWGHVELAGIVRYMRWDDATNDGYDVSGSTIGWGLNLSSNIKISKDLLRLQVVYGAGIQNYMNEGPADIGAEANPGDTENPGQGEGPPVARDRRLPRTQLERTVEQLRRLFQREHHPDGPADRGRVQTRPLCPCEHSIFAGPQSLDRVGVPVRPAGEQFRRLEGERLQDPVRREVQLLAADRRVMPMRTRTLLRLCGGVLILALITGTSANAQSPAAIDAALKAAYAKYRDLQEGKNADYIPALARVDPKLFGIALVTGDGKVYTVGDVTTEVSIQSISKVFTMAQVIQEQGPDVIATDHRRGCHRNAIQLDRQRRDLEEDRRGAGDESAGQSGGDHGDEHGEGCERRRGLGEDHRDRE